MTSGPTASAQMKGILFIVASNGIFGLTDALSKVLTGDYPPGEILFFRSVFVFVSVSSDITNRNTFTGFS